MDPSFLLILSNLLHLQNYLDPSNPLLPSSSSTSTSGGAAPLLFFTITSILSYALSLQSPSTPSSSSSPPFHSDPLSRDAHYRSSYGLSYHLFSTLLDHLKPHLMESNLSVSPSTALSIVLSRLFHATSTKSLAARHAVKPLLVSKLTNTITRLLATKIYSEYIKIPSGRRLLQTIQSYKELTNVPNMCGAIDGSPIKIKRLPVSDPSLNPSTYRCRYNYIAILLQVVTDHRKIFWDVCVKAPGGVDDATHFRESLLYNRLASGEILHDPVITVKGHHVRPYIIGDWCYPLQSFLLNPFSSNSTGTPAQNLFDSKLMRARETVVNAIGLLKGRWKLLQDLDVGLNHCPQTIVACCVLHNMCQLSGEPEPPMWKESKETGPPARPLENEKSFYYFGERIRQAMADDLQERQQRMMSR